MRPAGLLEQVSLRPFNFLRIEASCRYLVPVTTLAQLEEALEFGDRQQVPVTPIGAGSNLFVTGDYPGLIILMRLPGIRISSQGSCARVDVEAGEPWHGLVEHTLRERWYGLENLALIPGSAGAAAVQNIGAYGAQLEDVLIEVRAIDRHQRKAVVLEAAECQLGYRDSRFKRDPERFVITGLALQLQARSRCQLAYPGLRAALQQQGIETPTGEQIAAAVMHVRRQRLPDPSLEPNLGSFFQNPLVGARERERLLATWPAMPIHAEGTQWKLSAAWLIERSGMKGFRVGDAAVSQRHSLVLVNLGAASATDFLELVKRIRSRVAALFGVDLELEPRTLERP